MIDAELRAQLAARSPYNVVEIDLPRRGCAQASTPTMADWQQRGVLVREDEPAIWALRQDYTAPDGSAAPAPAFFARVRVEDYGPGRIRPHERTHPGPKEDRLRLTRATRTNLSPIFSLFPDRDGAAGRASSGAPRPSRSPRPPTTRAPATRSGASPTPDRSPSCRRRWPTPSC